MVPGMGTDFFFPDSKSFRLVKIKPEAEPGAVGESMLAHLLLIGRFSDPFEMAIFAVVVAVVSEFPV